MRIAAERLLVHVLHLVFEALRKAIRLAEVVVRVRLRLLGAHWWCSAKRACRKVCCRSVASMAWKHSPKDRLEAGLVPIG